MSFIVHFVVCVCDGVCNVTVCCICVDWYSYVML